MSPHTHEVKATADGTGHVYHEESARTGEGRCLLIVRDDTTGAFAATSSGEFHPARLPEEPIDLVPPDLVPDGDPRYD